MEVKLLETTPNAMELLIFTKSTRLEMKPGLYEEIKAWPMEKKLEELEYMANTIPSSWEFVDYIFSINGVSRAFTHQFVRTRTGTYAQQTMRILNMAGFDYIINEPLKRLGGEALEYYKSLMRTIQVGYADLIRLGTSEEDARGVLPTNISTNIVVKHNLRTMSDLARSRTGGRTQEEYRLVMDAMVNEILAVHPWAEKFLFPKGRQAFEPLENLIKFVRPLVPKKMIDDALKAIDHLRKAA